MAWSCPGSPRTPQHRYGGAPHQHRRAVFTGVSGLLLFVSCVETDVTFAPCCTARAEENFSIQADATGRTRFRLDGINGNIVVVGRSATQTVLIQGTRRVESNDLSDAQANLGNLRVEVTQTADEVAVRTTQPAETSNRNFVVDYDIAVPSGLMVQLTNVNGNVTVDAVKSSADVELTNGNVILQEIEGNVTLDLVNGNIDAQVTPPADGAIIMTSVNGNLGLDVPTSVSAELSMTVTNGTLSVANLAVQNQTSSATMLTGTLGQGNGEITLRTTNGNISLTGF